MTGVYTVSQISAYIKNVFSRDFVLRDIRVGGEISNCTYHGSGHIYFTLKDDNSAVSCIMFSSFREGLSFQLKNGQRVEVRGQISFYEKTGTCQLYAREVKQAGLGELYERFLKLKERLEESGMFDPAYKKPVPLYAHRIGIVTAPTGAAIRDIVNVATRRNPYVELILYPSLVQGDNAAADIVRGIRTLDSMGLDVLIVGRGGGSLEDLFAFNDEGVARAIFECETPVISAVGHETDFTIADFTADLRAPTPSAAAELATFEYEAFCHELSARQSMLRRAMDVKTDRLKNRVTAYRLRTEAFAPGAVLKNCRSELKRIGNDMQKRMEEKTAEARKRSEEYCAVLNRATADKMLLAKHRLELLSSALWERSPLRKLGGGYGYIQGPEGCGIRSVKEALPGDRLKVTLKDGKLLVRTEEIEYNPMPGQDSRTGMQAPD